MKKISESAIRENIEIKGFSGGRIIVFGHHIGRFVTYGHSSGNGKTVYASRIYGKVKVEVEASGLTALSNKVSRALARELKDKGFSIEEIGTPVAKPNSTEKMSGKRCEN